MLFFKNILISILLIFSFYDSYGINGIVDGNITNKVNSNIYDKKKNAVFKNKLIYNFGILVTIVAVYGIVIKSSGGKKPILTSEIVDCVGDSRVEAITKNRQKELNGPFDGTEGGKQEIKRQTDDNTQNSATQADDNSKESHREQPEMSEKPSIERQTIKKVKRDSSVTKVNTYKELLQEYLLDLEKNYMTFLDVDADDKAISLNLFAKKIEEKTLITEADNEENEYYLEFLGLCIRLRDYSKMILGFSDNDIKQYVKKKMREHNIINGMVTELVLLSLRKKENSNNEKQYQEAHDEWSSLLINISSMIETELKIIAIEKCEKELEIQCELSEEEDKRQKQEIDDYVAKENAVVLSVYNDVLGTSRGRLGDRCGECATAFLSKKLVKDHQYKNFLEEIDRYPRRSGYLDLGGDKICKNRDIGLREDNILMAPIGEDGLMYKQSEDKRKKYNFDKVISYFAELENGYYLLISLVANGHFVVLEKKANGYYLIYDAMKLVENIACAVYHHKYYPNEENFFKFINMPMQGAGGRRIFISHVGSTPGIMELLQELIINYGKYPEIMPNYTN